MASLSAFAAMGTWLNSSTVHSGNWSDSTKWQSGIIPDAAGDIANFNIDYGTANKTNTIDGTSRTVGTLNIGDPSVTYRAVTIQASGGASLVFDNSGGGALLAKAANANNVVDAITAPVILADNLTVNNANTTSGNEIKIQGVISETGGARSITKNGGGVLTLGNYSGTVISPANTFSGGFNLNAGEVQLSGAAVYGTGILTINGGTLTARGGSRAPINPVVVGGDFTLGGANGGGNLMSLGGPVDLGGSTRTISVDATGGAAISGIISNGGLTKSGLRTLTLSGNSTYSGGTTIAAGTLLVNNTSGSGTGTGQVTVNDSGTLAGTGFIAGPVFVASNGTIGAGDASAAVGTLTINNSLTLQGVANFRISKSGAVRTNDQIVGVSALTYGGKLTITNVTTDATSLSVGDTFTLFSATSHLGSFANIVDANASGTLFSFTNGVLTVVSVSSNNPNGVVVDAGVPLTNYTGLGEWETNANFESWTTTSVSGATVSGGTLSGTGTAATAQVSKLSIANGPDLDLGFNDLLELRIQVPASFGGAILVYYGATASIGISSSRVMTIPNAFIPKDGGMHSYRFDLGLEVPWRGNLTDLRVELTSATGVAFAVDYLRVGDLTGEVYQPRYTTECPTAGGTTPAGAIYGPSQTVYSMESKHFRFLWNDAVAANGSWTTNMPHGTLRNAEEAWQVMIKELGYREPCFAIGTTSGTRYKVNITTWNSGYWAGQDGSYARLNITPDGIRVDPPGLVLPHEFTHVIQFHNGTGYVPGSWWEGHANYGRERYLEHFGAFFASNARSGIDPTYLRCAHQLIAEGRDYYLSWPLFLYLDENPDNLLDLGEGTMVKLWQQCQINEYPLMTLERLTPTSNIKDIVGYFARREATFNYAHKADIQAALATFGAPLDNAATARWQFTDLVQRSDDTNWWRVPYEMAPMQGAYAIHELVPIGTGAGRMVTVNFHGLPDSTRDADWRASFIVIADDGTERYSTLWNNGVNSVTLAANENKVYLSVAGAPATFYTGGVAGFEGDYDESLYPYRSWPSKSRFPYELQVTGATPKIRDNGSTSGLVQHSNGGGYKASTATVDLTAYLGPSARVLGTAKVRANARIEDYAVVSGSAIVTNSAVVSGHAWVRDTAIVQDNAKVRDWALVEQTATVSGNGRVLEHANIKGGTVTDMATAKGTAASLSGTLAGNAIIDGDYGDFFYGRDLTNVIAFGHLPYVGVPDSFTHPLPTALYAAYDFARAHDSRIFDQYGITDGFIQGNPTWYAGDGRRAGFLAFNGMNQFVTLDRSLCDLRQITITAWVKWSGGVSNQPVFYLGSATNRCLFLTPDDGSGNAKFSIANGAAAQTLTASALPVGAWAHVAVTLDGTNAAFYVNGVLAASGANTNRADQLLAPNTATNLQQNYLARGMGNSLPYFQGAMDGVQFYAAALSFGSIAAMVPVGPVGTGTLYVDLRATNASSGVAATFTTWTNFGATIGNFTKTGTTTFTNNVSGTQFPGVLFDGASGLYSSANTSLADITGASDRTLEVWVYNPALANEETMVSLGDRSGTRKDCAFNFGSASGWGAVTHFNDDVSWGSSQPSASAWHHLVYTYDGTTNVQIYVDGALWTSDTLGGVLVTPTGDPINIGCQRAMGGGGTASQFFSGYINAVRVWGGVMTPAQITANYLFGPWPASAPGGITFAAISNVTLNAGVRLNMTNSATDPNQPPLPLSFSILSAPAGATIDSGNGLFTWRPAVAQAGTTNLITLRVTNNATPSLAATQSFVATINPVSTPAISNALLSNGAFGFQINGTAGPDFMIQASTNLLNWSTLFTTNPPVLPFTWVDPNSPSSPAQFYRVLLGP